MGGLRHIKAERRQLVAAYRKRIQVWTLERMPTIPDDQWAEFTKWVEAFGKND